jgi:hypothetical protein
MGSAHAGTQITHIPLDPEGPDIYLMIPFYKAVGTFVLFLAMVS